MQNDGGGFNKKEAVLKILEGVQHKFRYAPSAKFLAEVATYLSTRLKISELEYYCANLPIKYHSFPDLKTIEADVRAIVARPAQIRATSAPKPQTISWVSKQAAGTPALAEALFTLIKKGLTGTPRFTIARNSAWAKRLTDDELWICYEYWTRGEVHPLTLADDPFAEKRGDLKK